MVPVDAVDHVGNKVHVDKERAHVAGAPMLPGAPANFWSSLRSALRANDARFVRDIEALRSDAGVSPTVSVIRILDVAIWMHHHADRFVSVETPQQQVLLAATAISIVPVVIFYLLAQKHIVQGLGAGGLK